MAKETGEDVNWLFYHQIDVLFFVLFGDKNVFSAWFEFVIQDFTQNLEISREVHFQAAFLKKRIKMEINRVRRVTQTQGTKITSRRRSSSHFQLSYFDVVVANPDDGVVEFLIDAFQITHGHFLFLQFRE